jgi:hypothetical protein
MIWEDGSPAPGPPVAECDGCKATAPILLHADCCTVPTGWYLHQTYDGLYTACSQACAEKVVEKYPS